MIYEIEEYLELSNKDKYNYLKKRMISIQDELKKLEDVIIQDNLFIKNLHVRTFCKINKLFKL
jgi:chromosome segregation ATPase